MRNFVIGLSLAACLIAGGGYVYGQAMTQHNLAKLPSDLTQQAQRACIFPAGGAAEVDCSAGAAYSAQLNAWSRYIVQCTAGAQWTTTTVSSGADADAADLYLPTGEWLEFMTTNTIRYFSCDSSVGIAGGGKCYYIECQ